MLKLKAQRSLATPMKRFRSARWIPRLVVRGLVFLLLVLEKQMSGLDESKGMGDGKTSSPDRVYGREWKLFGN